jgi:hypothetical protein
MQLVLRAAVALPALLLILLGAAFLVTPGLVMPELGLAATAPAGLSFMHGDVAGSLLLIGGLVGRAALKGDGLKLDIPIIWVGLLITGRTIGLFTDPQGFETLRFLVLDLGLMAIFLVARWKMRSAA